MQINRTTDIETIGVDEFTMYPNPAKDLLNINIPYLQSFTIIDVSGKTVFNSTNKNLNQIDLSKYETGVYIIKVKTEKTTFNTRLLVK
jgi:broad specificity polyphosphatase/5'/3'-nucleotidase SurE